MQEWVCCLMQDPHKPPPPSMFLTNAKSLIHKMDEVELLMFGAAVIQYPKLG